MVLIGLTDGDGTVTTSPDSTSGDSSNDAGITVEESDADPSDSSPAGGAGAEEATERFSGLEDETLADSTTEEIVDVGNAASDVYTAQNRGNEEPQEELQNAVEEATGGSSEGIGRTGKAAAALLVGAALVGRS